MVALREPSIRSLPAAIRALDLAPGASRSVRAVDQPPRLLSIGEFAAATQLSPKALRLYDDQSLLPPATINAANGYRYYRSDQVPTGRMIRTLREMGLSLTEIGNVLAQEGAKAEALLSQLARELDRQYVRQKHAFQEALIMLRKPTQPDSPTILERMR